MEIKIKVKIGKKEFELTRDELEELRRELNSLGPNEMITRREYVEIVPRFPPSISVMYATGEWTSTEVTR